MKIDLPIEWVKLGRNEWKVVSAEIVDVAPQFSHVATFAVHKYPEPWFFKWAVTNAETGLRVGDGETKSAAIARARERLNSKSVQQIVTALRKKKPKP